MKQTNVRMMFLLAVMLGYGISFGQTSVATCPKKGNADRPILNCPKKGTKDCRYTVFFASLSINEAKADCPLQGTPECPLVKSCSKKGTADCPLVKKESVASYTAKATIVKKKDEANLPACCRNE